MHCGWRIAIGKTVLRWGRRRKNVWTVNVQTVAFCFGIIPEELFLLSWTSADDGRNSLVYQRGEIYTCINSWLYLLERNALRNRSYLLTFFFCGEDRTENDWSIKYKIFFSSHWWFNIISLFYCSVVCLLFVSHAVTKCFLFF